jgi:hypothetical protein
VAAVLMAIGVVLLVAGCALFDPRAAVVAAGLVLVAAGVDLGRP